MTIKDFKRAYSDEIKRGIVRFFNQEGYEGIIADRYVDGKFIISRNELNKIQAHIRKMGYRSSFGSGAYMPGKYFDEMPSLSDLVNQYIKQHGNDLPKDFNIKKYAH